MSDLNDLALELGLSPAMAKTLFSSVASACKTAEEQMLYLMKCKAHSLSPMRGELHAVRRREQDPPRSGNWVDKVGFVVSYHVFVERLRRTGWVLDGAEVWRGDKWGGWDAVDARPVAHVTAVDVSERGDVVGAWARATHLETGKQIGRFYPWEELAKLDGSGKPMGGWVRMPGMMAFKSAAERVGRQVAPGEFSGLYGAEEMGDDVAALAPKAVEVAEAPPALPEPEPEQEASAVMLPDDELLSEFERLGNAIQDGQDDDESWFSFCSLYAEGERRKLDLFFEADPRKDRADAIERLRELTKGKQRAADRVIAKLHLLGRKSVSSCKFTELLDLQQAASIPN